MTKRLLLFSCLLFVVISSVPVCADTIPSTIATFADPSPGSSSPLFTADFSDNLTGGWDDSKTGLTLQIPFSGNTFTNAWFEMSPLDLTPQVPGMVYETGGGSISFYADLGTNPLLVFTFDKGMLSPFGFGSNETLLLADVTITGSEVTGGVFSQEQFAFSLSNLTPLAGSFNNGFTATGSFSSSAIHVPEPATLGLLGFGALSIFKRKNIKP